MYHRLPFFLFLGSLLLNWAACAPKDEALLGHYQQQLDQQTAIFEAENQRTLQQVQTGILGGQLPEVLIPVADSLHAMNDALIAQLDVLSKADFDERRRQLDRAYVAFFERLWKRPGDFPATVFAEGEQRAIFLEGLSQALSSVWLSLPDMEKAQQLKALHLNETIVLQQLVGALSSSSFCHFGYSSFFVQPSYSSVVLGDTLWLSIGSRTPLPSRQKVSYALDGHPIEGKTHVLRPLEAGLWEYEVEATLHVPWSSKTQTVQTHFQYRVLSQ